LNLNEFHNPKVHGVEGKCKPNYFRL
jgi:hypothetical protein